ncbi:universal stress protein [Aeromicrobium sp.]|uniref:universal stress protein n=1 Tax=Aeromicrobium sp. TaxID=1871063 RepID=UPI0019842811|nr:universal stress protein [Aeromicrobium sp.]MBC7633597.1 universal stress protein [Aeromicrobium sp.]
MNASHQPVVVGVSDKQPTAVRYAVAEAGRLRTSLRVVHCYELPAQAAEFYIGTDMLDSMRISGESVLDDAREVVEGESSAIEVEYVLAHGVPDQVLRAESAEAGSMILGADDVPWFDRMLGSEVSSFIARKAKCPVVIVPERGVRSADTGGVVVTIDGDTSAAGPLRYGFEQADARGEKLVVLHVAPTATLPQDFEDHQANVAEVVAGWQELYPGVQVLRSTTTGDPVEISIASTADASLVVIGRPHGHTVPFATARPVAMQVLREAQCPVAIVPADYL